MDLVARRWRESLFLLNFLRFLVMSWMVRNIGHVDQPTGFFFGNLVGEKNQASQKDVYCIHDLLDHNRNMMEFIDLLVAWLIWVLVSSYSRKKGPAHILCISLWIFLAVSHQLTHALTDYNKNSQPCSCGFSPKCPATVRSLLQWARNFQYHNFGPNNPWVLRAKGQEGLPRLNFGWQKWWKTAFAKVDPNRFPSKLWMSFWLSVLMSESQWNGNYMMYILVIFQGLLIRLWGGLCEQSCQHAIGFFQFQSIWVFP